ncbi:hypothetical protein [Pseudofrankia sp. BMG5.37]|uniref:hypothetical protein n=1 Tax=Pseudofrankia sp. BMG5.37 TaxID=3050035 RepID=UPI0028943B53|nr:hypothetical protein [Pseudofrankia sp. BMG5.37]MDT3438821.1 hypothetical protein [Pseudofrankia sp. BMG5.37]
MEPLWPVQVAAKEVHQLIYQAFYAQRGSQRWPVKIHVEYVVEYGPLDQLPPAHGQGPHRRRCVHRGHVERLPSGSLWVVVFAGRDDVTGKPIYLKETVKRSEDVAAARARLLAKAGAGRRPERNATVERLVEEYLATADIAPTTRHTYAGYARRNIVPTIGKKTVREIRTRALETMYARLRGPAGSSATAAPQGQDSPEADPRTRRSHLPTAPRGTRPDRWRARRGRRRTG